MIIMVVMTGTHPYSPLYDILNVILYTLYYNDIINNYYQFQTQQPHITTNKKPDHMPTRSRRSCWTSGPSQSSGYLDPTIP
jgi:hypothetical protein